jgi:Na+/proline symporter
MVGGLLAVVLTESIQTIVLLLGAVCITAIGFKMVGGWSELRAGVHPVNLTILRPSTDPTGITWYAVFLGYPVLGVWYWCTDQTIVQRVLGAKDENHARIGPLFAGFIKILPVFLFVLPGVMALALVNSGKIPPLPVNADGSPMTERTYTHMIKTMLWPGMQGIVIAAMLAALMSTVSGALNSIATLFSYDIYKRWRPQTDDKSLVWIGRVATFAAMCVAIVWSTALSGMGKTIFQAMVDVFPVVAPPTAVVFLWGVFWQRTSAKAALWTLIGGSLLGLTIYVLGMLSNYGVLQSDVYPRLASMGLGWIQHNLDALLAVNSLFMAFVLFVAESIFIFGVSLFWPHEHTAESRALVWKSPWEALRRSETTWRGLLDFRVASVLLILTMVGLYVAFSSRTTYYPIAGNVYLDGKPVIGAMIYFDTDGETIDAELPTGVAGAYAFGTAQRAGGAPAGTKYRVRVEPRYDYLVRLKPAAREVDRVLAFMRTGTPVGEQSDGNARKFFIQTDPPQAIPVGRDDIVEVWKATPVPQRYRQFASSGLELVVPDQVAKLDLDLKTDEPQRIASSPH